LFEDVEEVFKSASRVEFSKQDPCSRLIYLDVDETLENATPVIASQFILGRVLESLRGQSLSEIRRLIRLAAKHGGSLFGGGYEVFCHKVIPDLREDESYSLEEWALTKAGRLTRNGLVGRVSFKKWQQRVAEYLESAKLRKHEFPSGFYVAPSNMNWPCFDSYGRHTCKVKNSSGEVIEEYTGLIGFQMTIAPTHAVMEGEQGRDEFLQFLLKANPPRLRRRNRPWFIFVVPDIRMFTPFVPNDDKLRKCLSQARIFVMELRLGEEPDPDLRTSTDPPKGTMNTDKHKRDTSREKRFGPEE
jgi:hypothetical protein